MNNKRKIYWKKYSIVTASLVICISGLTQYATKVSALSLTSQPTVETKSYIQYPYGTTTKTDQLSDTWSNEILVNIGSSRVLVGKPITTNVVSLGKTVKFDVVYYYTYR
ncbi:MAG: hypothetical protein ACI31W_07410 [Lactococcus sp.]